MPDYSWMPPNRRHIWARLYLPGVRCEGAGEIAMAVDCSVVDQRASARFLRGGNPLHSRRTTTEPGARALLRYRGPQRPRTMRQGSRSHSLQWAEGNELHALLQLVGRARNCAADPGLPHRPMRRIPERSSCLPSVVGLHRVAPSAFRASNSNGSGLAAPASVAF